ncbi:MAG: NAD(P)-dependent oxidoreductase [Salinivirgaceae bacterium]|nr:NAD(P)-dependent oxidoreductase [Salinivirgaceae bacterium]MDD4746290.1 NAD(P)-dependent oxidoreductase [Salinivirgaceae bacterium]
MIKIHQIEPLNIDKELQDYYKNVATRNDFILKVWDNRPTEKADIIARCKDADVVIVSNIPFGKEILDALPNLKMISVAFAGIDHIDMEECNKRNIIVKNAAGYSTHSVAELTIGMIISLLRDIIPNASRTLQGEGRNNYTGVELHKKTVGIIGMGKIGQEVARLCNAFGCNVIAWSRTIKKIPNVQFQTLPQVLENSDVVTVHVPLNKETNGLIGQQELSYMKPTAFLINTARGPVIDTVALYAALQNETIAGAALDVYDYEPPLKSDFILLKAQNILMLPHIAYATFEAFELRAKIVFENIFVWKENQEKTSFV